MTQSNIDPADIKEKLIRLREELLALEGGNIGESKLIVLDQSRVGRLSRMDAMQMQEMSKEAK